MILHRFFDFLRLFNAKAPSLIEARWALKFHSREDFVKGILKRRSYGQSLKTIAKGESLSEEDVRKLLIQAAEGARKRSRNKGK